MSEQVSWLVAVARVRRETGFTQQEAEALLQAAIRLDDAVKVVTDDYETYVRNVPGCNYLHTGGPSRSDGLHPYRRIKFVNLPSLQTWLASLNFNSPPGRASGSPKDRRGGKEKADWDAYRQEFVQKVATDGFPDKNNVEGWQWQADVQRWLADLVQRDGYDVAASTLARHAKELMEQYPEHP